MQRFTADATCSLPALTLIALIMTGCASSVSNTVSYNQPGEIRNTTETAPADLQLSCASAAANQFGLASDKVLPTASSKLLDGTYNIELMAEDQGYLCRIDENATILAITPA